MIKDDEARGLIAIEKLAMIDGRNTINIAQSLQRERNRLQSLFIVRFQGDTKAICGEFLIFDFFLSTGL